MQTQSRLFWMVLALAALSSACDMFVTVECDPAVDPSCGTAAKSCISHQHQGCVNRDLHWYNSCGTAEEIIQTCPIACITDHCEGCTPDAELRCVGTELYWFDSCGTQGALKNHCPLGCSGGACQQGSTFCGNGTCDGGETSVNCPQDCSAAPSCTDDPREQNDTQYQGSSINTGVLSGLTICPGDDDWYQIYVPSGQTFTARIDFSYAIGNLDMKLFDGGGYELTSSSTFGDYEQVTWSGYVGNLFIKVYGVNQAKNTYSLTTTMTTTPPACTENWSCGGWSTCDCSGIQNRTCSDLNYCGTTISKPSEAQTCATCGNGTCDCGETSGTCLADCPILCTDDGYEPNDLQNNAYAVSAGTINGLQICAADPDFYKIYVKAGERLNAQIDFLHSSGDLDLKLLDESGTQLGQSTGVTNTESIQRDGSAAFYYLWAYGFNAGVTNSYAMTLTKTCIVDSYEPSTQSTPAVLAGAGIYNNLAICDSDADWYKITVAPGQTLSIQMALKNTDGDLDMVLYDNVATQLANAMTTADTEILNPTFLNATTNLSGSPVDWFLKVYGYGVGGNPPFAINGYKLTVTITP